MFSRSEKPEEVVDPMAEPSGERSPMVLAALAGLLAIAGAFLLVWYLNSGNDEVAGEDGTAQSATAPAETSRQVLVVTQTIPRGTSVNELIEAPTVYLSARAVPEQFVAASAITSVAELNDLAGLVLASEALPGEQLLRGRFRDPGDFDTNEETFLESQISIDIPPGHHATVINLSASRALGGNLRPGELVTVTGAFNVRPPEGSPFEISVVVLNSIEVLSVVSSLEVAGSLTNDINAVGTANQGTYAVTVAVTPEELTDLTYAMSYGEIILATAVEGLDNEDGPKAITVMDQIIGDDGIWLAELDDGNLVDILGAFAAIDITDGAQGESIQLDLPDEDDSEDEEPELELADADEDLGDS